MTVGKNLCNASEIGFVVSVRPSLSFALDRRSVLNERNAVLLLQPIARSSEAEAPPAQHTNASAVLSGGVEGQRGEMPSGHHCCLDGLFIIRVTPTAEHTSASRLVTPVFCARAGEWLEWNASLR